MAARADSVLTCLLLSIFLAVGCQRIEPGPALDVAQTEEFANKVPLDTDFSSLSEYEEVPDEADAELVFVVEVYIPAWSQADEHRFLLRRSQPDPDQSRDHIAGHGWCGCGGSGGCSGSISLESLIPNAGKVVVRLSMSWSYDNGNSGDFKKDIEFPWFADSKQEFEGGIWVRSYFVDVGT